jgi:hypothetical protein
MANVNKTTPKRSTGAIRKDLANTRKSEDVVIDMAPTLFGATGGQYFEQSNAKHCSDYDARSGHFPEQTKYVPNNVGNDDIYAKHYSGYDARSGHYPKQTKNIPNYVGNNDIYVKHCSGNKARSGHCPEQPKYVRNDDIQAPAKEEYLQPTYGHYTSNRWNQATTESFQGDVRGQVPQSPAYLNNVNNRPVENGFGELINLMKRQQIEDLPEFFGDEESWPLFYAQYVTTCKGGNFYLMKILED